MVKKNSRIRKSVAQQEKRFHENGTPRGEFRIRRAGLVLKYNQETAGQGEAVKKALELVHQGVAPRKITQHPELKGIKFTKAESSVIEREFRTGPGAIIFEKVKKREMPLLQAEQELRQEFGGEFDPFVLQRMREGRQEYQDEQNWARGIREKSQIRKSRPLITRITEQVRQGKINKYEAIEYLDISSIPISPEIKNALDWAGKEAQETKNAIQEVRQGIELGIIRTTSQANKVFQEKDVLAPTGFLSEIKTELRRSSSQASKARKQARKEKQRVEDNEKLRKLREKEGAKKDRKMQPEAVTPKQKPRQEPPKKKKSLWSRLFGR